MVQQVSNQNMGQFQDMLVIAIISNWTLSRKTYCCPILFTDSVFVVTSMAVILKLLMIEA